MAPSHSFVVAFLFSFFFCSLVPAFCLKNPDEFSAVPFRNVTTTQEEYEEFASARRELRTTGWWNVYGSRIYNSAGRQVLFSGAGWAGFETPDACAHGLWARNYGGMLSQMLRLGFNTVRLPFAGQTLLSTTMPNNINYYLNPDLQGLNSLQVMRKIVTAAGVRGMRVILDYHRIRLTTANEKGLWYDKQYPETVFINNWVKLARIFAKDPAVVMFDLFNEVHDDPSHPGPYWTFGSRNPKVEPYNYRTAVIRTGNAILAVNPNVIITVNGMWENSWWGGNLTRVIRFPVKLSRPHKLMYSAHEYGPYVFDQAFFHKPSFPVSMPARWDRLFGFLVKQHRYPVWIGEFGAKLIYPHQNSFDKIEAIWIHKFVAYIRANRLPWTFWSWGPDSVDTGGILTEDWVTPNAAKLKLLAPIMHRNYGPSPGQLFPR